MDHQRFRSVHDEPELAALSPDPEAGFHHAANPSTVVSASKTSPGEAFTQIVVS